MCYIKHLGNIVIIKIEGINWSLTPQNFAFSMVRHFIDLLILMIYPTSVRIMPALRNMTFPFSPKF